MKIEKNMLFNLVHNYMNDNDGNKDFLYGVQGTLDMLTKFFKVDKKIQFNKKFKTFALENFLCNDETKLETFENLMQLYVIKMNQITRTSNWTDYPEGSNRNLYPKQLELNVFKTLQECFNGIDIIIAIEDYDSEEENIFLKVYYEKMNGVKSYIEVTQHGDFEEEGENNTLNKNYYSLIELEKHLEQHIHYELLLLYTCLKNFYNYINPENVKKLLALELDKELEREVA